MTRTVTRVPQLVKLTPTLSTLGEWVNEYALEHDELVLPEWARGKCYYTSRDFIAHVERALPRNTRLTATLIEANGELGLPSGFLPPIGQYVNHYAVLLEVIFTSDSGRVTTEKLVVDFTAKQFGEECEFPWVAPQAHWQQKLKNHLVLRVGCKRVDFLYENYYLTNYVIKARDNS